MRAISERAHRQAAPRLSRTLTDVRALAVAEKRARKAREEEARRERAKEAERQRIESGARKNDDKAVEDARARYLARKAAAEKAAKK